MIVPLNRVEATAAAMAGDPNATLQLLQLAQPDIRRFARRQCRSSSDAEDAVQETMWLLYRRVHSLRAAGSLTYWLFTIVRRTCLRLAQAGILNPVQFTELIESEKFSTRPEHELRIDLAQAIGSLPLHYREIILLRDVQEMTIDEIATSLHLTREAVKAQLHRARVLVREYLLK